MRNVAPTTEVRRPRAFGAEKHYRTNQRVNAESLNGRKILERI